MILRQIENIILEKSAGIFSLHRREGEVTIDVTLREDLYDELIEELKTSLGGWQKDLIDIHHYRMSGGFIVVPIKATT